LRLERKWREGSHWRKRYEPPRSTYQRLCAPGILPLKERRQLRERYESLDPFDLKDDLEEKFKQILHPQAQMIGLPPKPALGFPPREARAKTQSSPPCSFYLASAHPKMYQHQETGR
jgi:hypothetical protein